MKHKDDNRYTHFICMPCYVKHEPGRQEISQGVVVMSPIEECCFCGNEDHGVFYRHNPEGLKCNDTAS